VFSYIGELRSLFPEVSVLALSATCTRKISKRVCKILQMDSNSAEIRISPNKPNIKLVVSKIPNIVEMAMTWVIDGLSDKTFPRSIIYCTSIKDASNIYAYIMAELPDCSEVHMYHSETPEESKTKILAGLKDSDSNTTIVIATNALDMGIDIVNYYTSV